MKRNPIQKLSPLQQNRLWRAAALLAVLALAWLIFSPGSGVLSILSKRKELQVQQIETANLVKENVELQVEIDKMKNDPEYLEEVARRDFGLLKPNERVYDFSKPGQESDKKN